MSDNPDTQPSPSPGTRSPIRGPRRYLTRQRPKATAEDLTDRKIRKWSEFWATIILSFATLLTAWAGYEAGKWGSNSAALNTQAAMMSIEGTRLRSEAQERLLIDLSLFTEWINATSSGNTQLADLYRARFRDGFRPAFDAWLATDPLTNPDAPDSPFEMPDYARIEKAAAETLIGHAGELGIIAEEAGAIGDRYTLIVVILAGALLLAGVADRFEWAELRAVVVAIALLVLLFCAVAVIRLPMA
ncbi:MAG TPA: hypothetical protein PK205_11300 [Promineifilum sp.]|nr:hypothetical protein [Promineifilum sp.]